MLEDLIKAEKLAKGSKWARLLHAPFKYISGQYFVKFKYNNTEGKKVICSTFFDRSMEVELPAGMDIYLLGIKSHDSEIRLAGYLIQKLQLGHTFVDVGAHYGYFSLLSAKLVGNQGKTFCFEASPNTFKTLKKNVRPYENILAINQACSDKNEVLSFYEFPLLYSEYNTIDIQQFSKEKWFSEAPPTLVDVEGITLDAFFENEDVTPDLIKIDVEGAENKVIRGLSETIKHLDDVEIILEFLTDQRSNQAHLEAAEILLSNGFNPYIILAGGTLERIQNGKIANAISDKKLDSDNVLFKKQL
ncbi:MAG: FkbM family methyltransferase [Bacteroidota bacterium]